MFSSVSFGFTQPCEVAITAHLQTKKLKHKEVEILTKSKIAHFGDLDLYSSIS